MSSSVVRAIGLGFVLWLSVVIIYVGHFAGGVFRFVLSLIGIVGIVRIVRTVTAPSKSYWWLVIPLQPFMAGAMLGVRGWLPVDSQTPAIIMAFLGVFTLVAIPLLFGYISVAAIYPIALFFDAKAVGKGTSQWQPNRYLYGGIGPILYGNPLLRYVTPTPDGAWVIEVVGSDTRGQCSGAEALDLRFRPFRIGTDGTHHVVHISTTGYSIH